MMFVPCAAGPTMDRTTVEQKENASSMEECLRMPHPGSGHRASLSKDGLHLGVESLTLCRLAADGAEAGDTKLLACLLTRVAPLLQCALCIHLLAPRRGSLAHDLASLALDQGRLGEAAHGFLLLAVEDCGLGKFAARDDAHLLDLLHGLHGFYGFHGCLHDLHPLHRCLRRDLHRLSLDRLHRERHDRPIRSGLRCEDYLSQWLGSA